MKRSKMKEITFSKVQLNFYGAFEKRINNVNDWSKWEYVCLCVCVYVISSIMSMFYVQFAAVYCGSLIR